MYLITDPLIRLESNFASFREKTSEKEKEVQTQWVKYLDPDLEHA